MSENYAKLQLETARARFHDLANRMDLMLDQTDDGLYCLDMLETLDEMKWQYLRIAAYTDALKSLE